MAVHVNEMVSEVTTEADTPASGATEPVDWEEQSRVRAAQAQVARDQRRTAAEGYDD